MFKKGPKIEIKLRKLDIKVIRFGWVVVSLNFLLVLFFYLDMPEIIPIHFNFKGEVDGYGSRNDIWFIPIINLITYYGLYLIITKMKPWFYNYPIKITDQNAEVAYRITTQILIWLNVGIALIFTLISIQTILYIHEVQQFNLTWLLIALTIIVTVSPFFGIFKLFKIPK